MFKVSFRKSQDFPAKEVRRTNDGKVTIVTLRGVVKLPKFLQAYVPMEILTWMDTCKNVDAYGTMSCMYLTVKGKARKADGDADNPVLGERIAECRAKLNLYRFMYGFISRLYVHYCRLLSSDTLTKGSREDDTIQGAMTKYANFRNREESHLKALLAHEPDTESSQKH